ncbi:hypothetical protein LMG28688_02536 [Paraburkholderia caffeinitolerans]|uniref:Surface antigen domain-containing protein n=1 Tax=Paraburkholderia caffeinitolerans TaxID=1723730 RepID=A0A6J5FY85_9BURK|nr:MULTISPECIES: RT0821/Lpp0805 family surface protein [Paraburkholderia]CAB3787768.1 hypothetical protein LMG28688_02536 [Paraburkholderia caffeinitolerans]
MSNHNSTGQAGREIHLAAALGALLLALASPPAWSAPGGFLESTPMSQLDKNDIAALNSTVSVVLNTKDDGESIQWSRPATADRAEVSATITPEGTSIKNGRTCRFVAVTVNAGPHAVKLRPQFCRTTQAEWELQGAQ